MLGTAQFREERTISALLAAAMRGSFAAANSPQNGCAAAGFYSTRRTMLTPRLEPAAAP